MASVISAAFLTSNHPALIAGSTRRYYRDPTIDRRGAHRLLAIPLVI